MPIVMPTGPCNNCWRNDPVVKTKKTKEYHSCRDFMLNRLFGVAKNA